jgi:parallel beta-helix repeat protein
MRTLPLAVALLALALPAAANAATIHVHPGDSIQAAVDAADPGDRVRVHPGVYEEAGRPCPGQFDEICAVVISKDRIKLDGRTVGGERTVLRATEGQDRGIFVGLPPVGTCLSDDDLVVRGSRISRMTVQGFEDDGVRLSCVRRYRITRVRAIENLEYGLFPVLSARGRIDHNLATGANDTGIYLGQSFRARIDHNRAVDNLSGYELENTSRVRLVRNVARGNTAGVLNFALPDLSVDSNARNLIKRNVIEANNRDNTCTTPGEVVCEVPSGTGILVLAADRARILRNEVSGNRTLGIAVANYCIVLGVPEGACADIDIEPNPDHNRIRRNELDGNGFDPDMDRLPAEAFAVDLAWDTSGTGNCWSGNGIATRFPDPLPSC